MSFLPETPNIDLLAGLLTRSCYTPSHHCQFERSREQLTVAKNITLKELTAAGTVLDLHQIPYLVFMLKYQRGKFTVFYLTNVLTILGINTY